MQLSADDVQTVELLPPFVRILTEVFVVRLTAAEGTCDLIDDDIDHCPVRDVSIGILAMNFIWVVLNRACLPEFVDFQVCPICAVMVSIV